jgi:3-mercaptopyruvate sulfurtransferase SseA
MLRDRGQQAWAITGGYAGWRRAGLPMEPKSAEIERTPPAICPLCHQPMSAHAA